MTRRSLRPQLNQIRSWVRQGRTDAWIAHQLEVPVQQIQAFKRENGLEPDSEANGSFTEDVDLRAEDDAAIAAELEAEQARRAEEEARKKADDEAKKAAEKERRAEQRKARAAAKKAEVEAPAEGDEEAAPKPRARRRSRKRTGAATPLEGTFDHGEEGYGLWLDPAVQDDPLYAEHWAGHRPVEVTIEEDQIVIKRVDG